MLSLSLLEVQVWSIHTMQPIVLQNTNRHLMNQSFLCSNSGNKIVYKIMFNLNTLTIFPKQEEYKMTYHQLTIHQMLNYIHYIKQGSNTFTGGASPRKRNTAGLYPSRIFHRVRNLCTFCYIKQMKSFLILLIRFI